MQLKKPSLANANLRSSRGLAEGARQAVFGVFGVPNIILSVIEGLAETQFVNVKPGEETDVPVELTRTQLPLNADVKSVVATLHVMKPDLTSLKGMEQSV